MIRDANALLGRYQAEIAAATTRALVAEQQLAEALEDLAAARAQVVELSEQADGDGADATVDG